VSQSSFLAIGGLPLMQFVLGRVIDFLSWVTVSALSRAIRCNQTHQNTSIYTAMYGKLHGLIHQVLSMLPLDCHFVLRFL
jgi:hypothetical protein